MTQTTTVPPGRARCPFSSESISTTESNQNDFKFKFTILFQINLKVWCAIPPERKFGFACRYIVTRKRVFTPPPPLAFMKSLRVAKLNAPCLKCLRDSLLYETLCRLHSQGVHCSCRGNIRSGSHLLLSVAVRAHCASVDKSVQPRYLSRVYDL